MRRETLAQVTWGAENLFWSPRGKDTTEETLMTREEILCWEIVGAKVLV